MRNVEKWSLGYELLRPLGQAIYRFGHRRVVVNGAHNIPKNEPVVLAPNHQNALMDSLAIVCNVRIQPVFLGRADMFKKKFFANFMYFLKIVPVYRIRDGKETLDKNQEIFEKCVDILKKKKYIIIFPEAAHIGMRSMLPHKKAIERIIFQAAEDTNFEMDIKIVPVGINYSHYYNFRRDVVVNFGEPISAKDYYAEYHKNGEARATTLMVKKLHNEIDRLIVNFPDKEHYDLYDQSFEIYQPQIYKALGVRNHPENFVQAGQFLNEKLKLALDIQPERLDDLTKSAEAYKKLKSKFNFSERVILKGKIGLAEQFAMLFSFLLLLPVSLPGAIVFGWLFWLTRYPARKGFQDKQFYATVAYATSFVAYPVWIVLLFAVLWSVLNSWIIALLIVVLSIPSGIIAWETGQLFTRLLQRRRINQLLKSKNTAIAKLYESRKEITSFLEKIIG